MHGTTSDGLDALERELDVRIPPDLRAGLNDPAVHEAFRSAMLDANPTLTDAAAVADTVRCLRVGNLRFRSGVEQRGWQDELANSEPASPQKPWPDEWLWIGGDFSGDAYFLDLTRHPAVMGLWNHDSLTCRVEKPSFADWADAYRGYGQDLLQSKPPPLAANPRCPNCGAELTARQARLCRSCGKRLSIS